ncbi:MAG: alpha/beta fold hydrolase [Acidimicrobiales bacterium]
MTAVDRGSGLSPEIAAWEARGAYQRVREHEIFVVDVPAASVEEQEPLLVLHGFPTCSFDFHLVVDELARHRRVLLLDMLGYGLSSKPDVAYRIELQADIVETVVANLLSEESGSSAGGTPSIPRLALLTHDMGDTVGGELLARNLEGKWPVEISRRVVTNGSIYIDMAHLSDGQSYLLSLPDERLSSKMDPTGAAMTEALAATLSPSSEVDRRELDDAWRLIEHNGGDVLLPRLIRYIEDRRSKEARYTGAIETHPSPLAIVWGWDDPIAVVKMASRLHEARPDAALVVLEGIGHYPMIESPQSFSEAVVAGLGG